MVYAFALFLLPPLLIFGIYHLTLWLNVLGIRGMVFWRRVALASAIAHVFLAAGLFLFSYLDYRANAALVGQAFDTFFFNRSAFWHVMLVFDTVPTVVLLGVFGVLDRFSISFLPVIPLTFGIVLLAGTIQWYWVGGGIAAACERLWSGLKTPDDEGPDWL